LSLLPVMPIAGPGRAPFQPIWAEDVADCVVAALDGRGETGRTRYELAGPDTLTYDGIVELVLRALGRRRPLAHVPLPLVRPGLRVVGVFFGQAAFATWEEAELMEVAMTSRSGTADAELLGVVPEPMGAVLGG